MITRELEKEVNELKKKVAELEKNQINIKGYCVSTGLVPPSKQEEPRYFRCISKEHAQTSDGYYGEFSLGLIYKEVIDDDDGDCGLLDDEEEFSTILTKGMEDFEEVKKPKKVEEYWFVDNTIGIGFFYWEEGNQIDYYRWKSGNVFESRLQAEKFRDLILKRKI